MAATLALPLKIDQMITVASRQLFSPKHLIESHQSSRARTKLLGTKNWRALIIDYVLYDIISNILQEASNICQHFYNFYFNSDTKTFNYLFLQCLSDIKAWELIEEARDGICETHQLRPKMHECIQRLHYYWPTMHQDAMDYPKSCHKRQIPYNLIHQPSERLHPTVAVWTFEA